MSRPKPLILDIDDDEAGRYAVGRQLKMAGFEVLGAATGETGLRLAEEHKPDLILLDVRLPDIDGFDVCRRIRENPRIADTPVLQVSASCIDAPSRIKGLDNGADAYLIEPLEPGILLATINSLMRLKTAEQRIRTDALRWQATFDAIQDGVAVLSESGEVLQTNQSFLKILGDSVHRARAILAEPFERLRATGTRQTEEQLLGDSSLAITMDPVFDDNRAFNGAVCTVTDITEKKSFDRQLRHTAKLESIGVLAGGIAHDFNNLLTGILGNSSLLMDSLPRRSPEFTMAEEILRASESAADLTRQILAYSGKGRFVLRPVDLSAIALESRSFVRRFIPGRVQLNYDLAESLPLIKADPSQMQQLIMNLIINAAESFDENAKGTIRVSTGVESVDSAFFRPGENPQPGEYVTLIVTDSGSGMDEATQNRIFDPFFTTKFAGRGLGLSAVHGILRGHSGFLRLKSAPGQGSTFRLYFPVDREAAKNSTVKRLTVAGRRNGTVLVIDDESTVRNFAKMALENLGYRVLLAENGAVGIEIFQKNQKSINLVLLDLTMPVMNGEETFDRIREIEPKIPVLLSSGFNHAVAIERFRTKAISGFIGKPYTVPQLDDAVHSAIRGAASSNPA